MPAVALRGLHDRVDAPTLPVREIPIHSARPASAWGVVAGVLSSGDVDDGAFAVPSHAWRRACLSSVVLGIDAAAVLVDLNKLPVAGVALTPRQWGPIAPVEHPELSPALDDAAVHGVGGSFDAGWEHAFPGVHAQDRSAVLQRHVQDVNGNVQNRS